MKTVFITIFDGAISKNILRSSFFQEIQKEFRVVLFVPAAKRVYYDTEFGGQNVIVETTPLPNYPNFERRFHSIALHSFPTRTVYLKIWYEFKKSGKFLRLLSRIFLWMSGKYTPLHRFMRSVYARINDNSFDSHFEKYSPDCVFVPNMMSNEDYRLIKASRRHRVVSIGMPKSWDNFTSKTFFNIFPDWIMVQNQIMKNQASDLFGYPQNRLLVVGFPQFDIYAGSVRRPRADFFQDCGLDPEKKTILYAAAGSQLAPHDEQVLSGLIQDIESDPVLRNRMQILVRPHPKYDFREDVVTLKKEFVSVDYPGTIRGSKRAHWEFRDTDVERLFESLYFSDILISTISTLNLEAAILNKPLISIGFDGNVTLPYVLSVARYYEYDHMLPLVRSGGMRVAYTRASLLDEVKRALTEPSIDTHGREILVSDLVGVCDGQAGDRVAKALISITTNYEKRRPEENI